MGYNNPPINFRAILSVTVHQHGAKSQDGYHAITSVCVDICPPNNIRRKETKPAEKSQLKSFTFSFLLFYMEEKQTCFVESSDSDIKKLVANAVPESTKKSTKYGVNIFEDEASYE